MKFSVAIAGKGGTGKTTLAALMIRALREQGVVPILAVDADPNSNLAEALGVPKGNKLAEIREEGSSPEGSPASGVGRLRAVEDRLQRAVVEGEGFDLVTMGRPEGPRCYCYVNSLLRRSLDRLASNYASVIVDNEAGMEHLSRRTTHKVDVLVVVADCTLPACRAAERIMNLSRQLPIEIGHRAVLLNRVAPGQTLDFWRAVVERSQAVPLPEVPQDNEVERSGAAGLSVFQLSADTPALKAVHRVVGALQDLVCTGCSAMHQECC